MKVLSDDIHITLSYVIAMKCVQYQAVSLYYCISVLLSIIVSYNDVNRTIRFLFSIFYIYNCRIKSLSPELYYFAINFKISIELMFQFLEKMFCHNL